MVFGVRPMPFPMPGFVAPDCAVWEDLPLSDTVLLPPGTDWSLPLMIPNQASLIGARATLQSVHGFLPLSLSNTLQITAGI